MEVSCRNVVREVSKVLELVVAESRLHPRLRQSCVTAVLWSGTVFALD
jgi:hypothetical protein